MGSNLGPLFFLIFINDICDSVQYSKVLKFADDLKIYKIINELQDCEKLQSDVNSLHKWSIPNKLPFHIGKCRIMSYSRCRNPIIFIYSMNDIQLERVNETVDLGVHFNSVLSFDDHILSVYSAAIKNLYYITWRGKYLSDPAALKALFNAFVRSKLEYAVEVWSPLSLRSIQLIERIQKRFLRFLLYRVSRVFSFRAPYNFLLTVFEMDELSERRHRFCVRFIEKLLNGELDDSNSLARLNFAVPDLRLRQRSFKLFRLDRCRTVDRTNSPFNRCMRLFNDELESVDDVSLF